ncbi:MAG TPA: DUF2330 domain-containing protein [Candidatus Sulfotelmatobacter sp.]|jgi:hypothetical protein|nr:DUF2330 domain-containing protein [Candidatus Sulfotelmatobacter sp.]
MKQLLVLGLAVMLTAATNAFADGMFVVQKFVWDKHTDINEPTQKAILAFDSGQEDLILQVKYEGPVDEFGWLIPVPNPPQVKLGSMKCFYELSRFTQMRFESEGYGRGHYGDTMSLNAGGPGDTEPPVKVVEIKTVGAYQIAVLSTKDTGALEQWLTANQFYFPTNKTDVLDSYVQQHWYFIAVKINLGKFGPGKSITAANTAISGELAAGELNPLQISFASDRCVFPLKISSVNGRPSEVQVYVLSPEPLLEQAMLEQKLPLMYSNAMVRAQARAESMRKTQSRSGLLAAIDSRREKRMAETPQPERGELWPYAQVAPGDLPDSAKLIPRLRGKSWWLTKQTWNFQPEEMRDLTFVPAFPYFSGLLATRYGYFAAANLAVFGSNALPVILTAFKSPDPKVRDQAATILENLHMPITDPQLSQTAAALLDDPEPKVRRTAVYSLLDNWDPKYVEALVAVSRDPDEDVARAADYGLGRHKEDVQKYIPALQAQLKDKDLRVRASAMKLLFYLGETDQVSRETFLSLMSLPDQEVIGVIIGHLRNRMDQRINLSDDEVAPLLQNTEPLARLMGLNVLYQNAENTGRQSVQMALPLLKDAEPGIRQRAAMVLRAMTGRHFTENQADQWQAWWTANQAGFTVELHPEELRPRRFRAALNGTNGPPPVRMAPETLSK